MSQTIRNIKDLSSAMDKYLYYAVDKSGEMIKEKIDEFIKYYYEELSPNRYIRSWRFLNSCIKTEPHKIPSGYEIEIYIDTSIHYPNGWTIEQTATYANNSLHGDIRVGDMQFWDDAVDEIKEGKMLTDAFIKFMNEKGISLKYR